MFDTLRSNRALPIIVNGLVVFFAVWALFRIGFGGIDLRVYREGALTLWHTPETLYEGHVGPDDGPRLPFTYPPFAAILFLPLAALPQNVAYLLLLIASAAVAFAVAWDLEPRLQRLLPKWGRLLNPFMVGLIFLVSGPVRDSMDFGQINVLLLGVAYLTFVRFRSLVPFAVVVGVCAGIKLTPLALLVAPFAMRQWRATAIGVASFLATQLVSLAFVPSNTIDYWTRVIVDPARIGNPGFIENVSIQGVLARIDASKLAWVAAAAVVGLLILAVMWAMASADKAAHFDRVTLIALAALASLLLSPVSWTHHWVWWPMIGYAWLQVCQYYWKQVRARHAAGGSGGDVGGRAVGSGGDAGGSVWMTADTARALTWIIVVALTLSLIVVFIEPRYIMQQFNYFTWENRYPPVAYVLPAIPIFGCIIAILAALPLLKPAAATDRDAEEVPAAA